MAVPGQHEVAGAFLCVLLLAAVVILRIEKLPTQQWMLSLGLAVVSLAVVMLSPGTARRAVQEHRHVWDVAHVPTWMAHSFYHGLNWLRYPSFLLAACCIILLSLQEQQRDLAELRPKRWLGLAAVVGMFIILSEFGLVEMASGNWSPDRVVAWYSFVFWLLFVCALLTGLTELSCVRFSQATRIGIFTLLAIALLGSTNFREAVEDLRGPAEAYWREGSAGAKARGGTVQFDVPSHYPNFAMHQQVTSNPGCWVNRCMANYLRASTVIGKNSTEDCP